MPRQSWSVSRRTVAITGGARGIGSATAAAFVRGGARVAIGDQVLARADASVRAAYEARAAGLAADEGTSGDRDSRPAERVAAA